MSTRESELSPNQQAKRESLIAAAMLVLRTQGLEACTARAIADASPLTKSALHYYFDDVDEIVELAFRRLMVQFLSLVEAAADAEDRPVDALWAACRTYLRLGSDRPERISMMWFEVQLAAARRGDVELIRDLSARALDVFRTLVAATGVDDVEHRTSILFSTLIGTVVRHSFDRQELDHVIAGLAIATGIAAPTRVE